MKYLPFALIFASCVCLAEPKQHPLNNNSENPIATPFESQQENATIQDLLNQLAQMPNLIIIADRTLEEGNRIIHQLTTILEERSE